LCVTPKPTVLGYCGRCPACKLVEAGTHPDLFAAYGEIKIGERGGSGVRESDAATARDIVRQLALHSYEGGRRVLLLGDVEFADHRSANALLKFFEEPPPRVVLILTTPAPGRLIATIRSRLIEVPFVALAGEEIVEILTRGGANREDAERAARTAGGNASLAKALVDESSTGVRAGAASWFFEAVRGGVPDGSWADRQTLEEGLAIVRVLARDWAVRSAGGREPRILALDQTAAIEKLPADAQRSIRALEAVAEAQRTARSNVTPALVLQLLQMKIWA
jgi:hypothetical protein